MNFILLSALLLILLCSTRQFTKADIPKTNIHRILLDSEFDIKLKWFIDYDKEEVLFYVKNAFDDESKWFGFGFSSRGKKERSDMCIFSKKNHKHLLSMDGYLNDQELLMKDNNQQDCELLQMTETSVAFKRKFDTCDDDDIRMNGGTMNILWARGNNYLNSTKKINEQCNENLTALSSIEGVIMLQVLRANRPDVPEKDTLSIEVAVNQVHIPNEETTYWCHIHKMDDFIKTKHHIVEFQPKITSDMLVHHMELFHCETDASTKIPLYDGNCNDLPKEAEVCKRVVSLWAMGASSFTYPVEAGLPIGGQNYNPYFRLEVHYNNPKLIDGIIDSSGLILKITDKLRKYDSAIMELGLEYTDKMAIPQGILAFPLSGYCIAECTKVAFPVTGITIFGSQLHTHLRGVRILTRHYRGHNELPEINRDDYYSHHFQEIRLLRQYAKVLPGDALVTTCYYDTIGYNNTTLGGFSISDEMCVNYIQYYPATELEVCKSSVSEKSLTNYFNRMKRYGPRSQNYKSIDWNLSRIKELYTMYVEEPLSMQCNQSDGYRFNGNWENVPSTQMALPPMINPLTQCVETPNSLNMGRCGFTGECIY